MRKSGIIITLIGIGLFLISIFASEKYDPRRDIISNMYSMEMVLDSGRLVYEENERPKQYSTPAIKEKENKKESESPPPGMIKNREAYGRLLDAFKRDPGSFYIPPKIEGRKSISLTGLLALSTIITLFGIGQILLSKKQNKTA